MSILRFLYQFLCAFLQIKYCKHIEQKFCFCCWGHDPGVGLGGAGWIKNFSVGIRDGTPSTVHSSLICAQCIEGKQKSDISKGHNSVTNLRTMTGYNLNLDLVNINSHKKFGKILSMSSCNTERKQKSNIN